MTRYHDLPLVKRIGIVSAFVAVIFFGNAFAGERQGISRRLICAEIERHKNGGYRRAAHKTKNSQALTRWAEVPNGQLQMDYNPQCLTRITNWR